jgi:hypothetical protein
VSIRAKNILPLLIVLIALAIRLYPIAAKLPHTYWHDENSYIEMALRFGKGDINLITYAHGSVYQALLFFLYAALYMAERVMGTIASPADFYINYLKDPTVLFIIARAVSVSCGTLAVYLTYRISAGIYGMRAALAAGFFAACAMLMVQMSSFALADMLSIFLLLTGFLALICSIEKKSESGLFFAAAFLIGLASGCKYYAVFGVAPLLVGAFIKSGHYTNRITRFLYLAAAAVVLSGSGFFIGMPFALGHFKEFYNDTFVKAVGEYIVRNPNKHTWLFYITNHLRNGLGIPLEIVSISGVAYALFRRSKWDMLILSFPAAYYLLLMHSISFAYHMLPAIPFILILGGRLMDDITKALSPKRSAPALACLCAIVAAPTLCDSVKYAGVLAGRDTRTEAANWVKGNIYSGERILSEGYIATLPMHAAPIPEDLATLKRDLENVVKNKGSGFSENIKIANFDKVFRAEKAYDIFKTYRLGKGDIDGYHGRYIILSGSNDIVTGEELSYYLEDGYYQNRTELKDRIAGDYELIKTFRPMPEFSSMFPHMVDRDYRAIRNAPLVKIKEYQSGPRIDIYKRGSK